MGDSPIAFIRQSIRDFRSTGSLAPSSLFLARAMAKKLPEIKESTRILEVGSGTGSVTVELARRMGGRGMLTLSELSPDFCRLLRERIGREPVFRALNGCVHLHEGDILTLPANGDYDAIVCGLPFTNFRPIEVERFFQHFQKLLKPNGTLMWYEYVFIQKLRMGFMSKAEREDLKNIKEFTARLARQHQYKEEIVTINLPPARIRHLKFG